MNKRILRKSLVISIMLLFIVPAGTIGIKQSTVATLGGDTLYVGGSGVGNYTRIQDAIDNASDGDTVFVYNDSSPYYENIVVDKSITLIGENVWTTISGNASGDVVYVSADWVNINGFTISGSGIYLSYSSNNTITCNNILSNYRNGIYLSYSSNNNITGNNISTNNKQGIYLKYSSNNNNITGNNISNNGNGIYLKYSSNNNNITDNNISNNRHGISLYSTGNTITGNSISNNGDGIYLYESSGNTVTGNNISNNRYGIRLREFSSNNIITGNNISNHERGISLESSGNTVTGNNISNNEYGIRIYSSSGSTVMDNNISNNWDGIYLKYSSNNNITGNNISNNYKGIYLLHYLSNNNTITGNTISNNENGIYLESSGSNNIISYNSFFNDSLYVYDSYQNNVFNNTVNGKPLVYLEDESDLVIDDAGQIILIKCDNITVQNQELSTSIGIWLWDTNNCLFSGNTISSGLFLISSSSNNTITGNNISNNRYGIHLESSSNNNITGNNISNNRYGIHLLYSSSNNNITGNNISNNRYGIHLLYSSSNNNITGNNISNNDDGIYFYNSNYNTIYNNYFNNINNVHDGGNNTWNISKNLGTNIIGGPYLGGNYWSDYTGVDLDGDGLGDTDLPYNSSGNIHNGGDWLPLVNSLPYIPSNPDPSGGLPVDIDVNLSWDGGDPDSGDTVTYDVYLGSYDPPPKVATVGPYPANQTRIQYDPGTLTYSTLYYWRIVSWDNHGASTAGPIWYFTTEEAPEPDLDCDGSLSWTDVKPSSTVKGNFTVENIGDSGSLLDWEIIDWPKDWGNWTFTPLSGNDLTPEVGPVTVNVSVVAPDEKNKNFNGNITIVNKENSNDYCTIRVYLSTPKNKAAYNSNTRIQDAINDANSRIR